MTVEMLREWLSDRGYSKASDSPDDELWMKYDIVQDVMIQVRILLDRYVATKCVLDAWSMYEISKLFVRGDVIDIPEIRSVLI